MGRAGGIGVTGGRALPRRAAGRVGILKARGLNLVEVALTLGVFMFLRDVDAIASTPVWMYCVLLVGGGAASALSLRRWPGDCATAQLHFRVITNVAVTTAVIYATGWGPALALGYMFVATDNIRHSGSRAAKPCLVWSAVGIGGGQLAIALNAAPTFISEPEVHGLSVLAALGLGFAMHTAGATTALKEQAESDVRRSEERFKSLVQHGSDVVAVVTPQGRISYVSPSIERMGYRPEEFSEQFERLHPDDVTSASVAFADAIANPGRLVQIELRMLHADGSYRWQDVSMTNRCDDPSVEGIVVNFHDISERKVAEEQLVHVAYHDRLTGLSNRTGFVQRLEQAVERARRHDLTTGLLFLDLDRFKVVNDTFGHNMGDRVLVQVADRLRQCVRDGDAIGRFGGDEFTILIEDVRDGNAESLAERVTARLRQPLIVNGKELMVSASVGLVMDDAAAPADDLLRCADLAMYFAKENGRARWELFDPSMGSAMLERYRIAAELRRALEHGELVTYYQPEISLETGEVIGFEALVRWAHPDRGLVLPGTFIPVAEQNDLILPIDRYVLSSACRQLMLFHAAGGTARELFMSINISPDSLTADGTDELLNIVDASGVDPTKLRLEITERTAITNDAASMAAIRRLREHDICVVIDDFGTGYSSLECLQRLPVDGLKIDRGFVAELDVTPAATAIVQAIVTLAAQLNLSLTAEGVETSAQLERLRALGCDSAQGFFFAPAMSADTVAELLELRFGGRSLADVD